jgi:hypothetical protein
MTHLTSHRRVISPLVALTIALAAGCASPSDDDEDAAENAGNALTSLPDLVVKDVVVSKPSPVAGDALLFSAVVANVGTKATASGAVIRVAFSIDGTRVSVSNTYKTALLPGASATLTANTGPTGSATWTATAGSHNLRAVVDAGNTIAESDETNNARTETLTVASSTDTSGGTTTAKVAMADSFVDSIGVVAHINWGGTIWDTAFDRYAPILGE